MHHIRNTLPEIKAKIQAGLAKYTAELMQLGDPITEDSSNQGCYAFPICEYQAALKLLLQSNLILNIITEFTNEYRTIIDGTSNEISSDELSGGARISFVFHEIYGAAIRSMDPFDQIKDVDIRTILYNSSVSLQSNTFAATCNLSSA